MSATDNDPSDPRRHSPDCVCRLCALHWRRACIQLEESRRAIESQWLEKFNAECERLRADLAAAQSQLAAVLAAVRYWVPEEVHAALLPAPSPGAGVLRNQAGEVITGDQEACGPSPGAGGTT